MLASEQQIWSDEIGCPGGIDCIEVVISGGRVDIRVKPFVGRRRWWGESCSKGSCDECCKYGCCNATCLDVRANPAGSAHGTTGEVLKIEGRVALHHAGM